MTQIEALRLLGAIWGSPGVASARDLERLQRVALPDETPLQTCARIAEVDVSGVKPFDTAHVSRLVAEKEVSLKRT